MWKNSIKHEHENLLHILQYETAAAAAAQQWGKSVFHYCLIYGYFHFIPHPAFGNRR